MQQMLDRLRAMEEQVTAAQALVQTNADLQSRLATLEARSSSSTTKNAQRVNSATTSERSMTTREFLKMDLDIIGFTMPKNVTQLAKVIEEWSTRIDGTFKPTDEAKHLLAISIIKKSEFADILEKYD